MTVSEKRIGALPQIMCVCAGVCVDWVGLGWVGGEESYPEKSRVMVKLATPCARHSIRSGGGGGARRAAACSVYRPVHRADKSIGLSVLSGRAPLGARNSTCRSGS